MLELLRPLAHRRTVLTFVITLVAGCGTSASLARDASPTQLAAALLSAGFIAFEVTMAVMAFTDLIGGDPRTGIITTYPRDRRRAITRAVRRGDLESLRVDEKPQAVQYAIASVEAIPLYASYGLLSASGLVCEGISGILRPTGQWLPPIVWAVILVAGIVVLALLPMQKRWLSKAESVTPQEPLPEFAS